MAAVLVDGRIDHSYGVAAAVLFIAGVSDFLDGYLARRWGITSVLGGFLDQIADKLVVAGTLFALVEVGRVWAWAGFLIVAREIAVTGLRGIAALPPARATLATLD
ncbi:MAG: CDP-alcohol phosphatidyltransferase family protein, partial [Acidimicrobiia bacterium]